MTIPTQKLRLSELLASLSLATDLATGQPLGHGLSTTLIAVKIAEDMGLGPEEVRSVYQVSLLRFLGCTSDASETAWMVGGDEISFNAGMAPLVSGGPAEALRALLRTVGPGETPSRRARLLARTMSDPGGARSLRAHCEVAAMLGRRLGVSHGVIDALSHAYERWDGKGFPEGLEGEAVPLEVRIATVADDAALFRRSGNDASTIFSARRGRAYDPAVVDAYHRIGPIAAETWEEVMESEPEPHTLVADLGLFLTAMADFVDLKSPWMRGHSRRVADITRTAALDFGLGDRQADALHAAGLMHDLGRVGVENGIWDKTGPLTVGEREKVMMHPYLTQRILSRCEALAPLGDLASTHHERLDGSGYHRQSSGDDLTLPSRILATADVLVALTSARPHRAALTLHEAGEVLKQEVEAGRLDPEAVSGVMTAAGGDMPPPERHNPADLTDREIEVLRLLAAGHTNRQVGEELYISPKTVGRHIENIYAKIGVSSRAAAAVFAMEHRLLG